MPTATQITTLPAAQAGSRRKRQMAPTERRWITVRDVAARIGISVPSVWRGVSAGRLPSPSYPTPQAARWDLEELDRAMEGLKAMPREAMASRRAARLSAIQNAE